MVAFDPPPIEMTASDHDEVEWQFEAPDLDFVAGWLRTRGLLAGFASGAESVQDQHDTYYDTDDWRFHRAGVALRLRRQGDSAEATLKALTAAQGALRQRREITEALPSGEVDALLAAPGPVGERVRAVAGTCPLQPLFAVHTERRRLPLLAGDAAAAEVALDASTITPPDGGASRALCRVEVEVLGGPAEAVAQFVEMLRGDCGLTPAATSKFEAGLALSGLAPAGKPDLGPTAVSAAQTVGEVAYAQLRRHFAAFLANEPGTRLGDDIEALHDMRVAARRLRAAMRLFADALPVRAARLERELKWIAGVLGQVRDLDVHLEALAAWAAAGVADEAALQPLRQLLGKQRAQARQRMLRALDSRRYARFVATFLAVIHAGPPARKPPAGVPVLAAAPGLVTDRYRRLRKAGDRLKASSPPASYHQARIRGKRLRYAVEFFEPIFGKPATAFVRRMVDLQDLLGAQQDAAVAGERLRALAVANARRLPTQTLFAMGELAQHNAQEAARLQERFQNVYGRITGKVWARLERALEHYTASPSSP